MAFNKVLSMSPGDIKQKENRVAADHDEAHEITEYHKRYI
jgi:hypothetical protein